MKQHLVFDLWYTLIYLDDGWKTFNLLKEDFNIPREAWVKNVKQLFLCKDYNDERSFLEEFSNNADIKIDIDTYASIMKSQIHYDLKHIKLYPESISILKRAKREGFNIGLISNQCSFYEPWFYNSDIAKYFDTVIFSNKLGFRKPNIKIYTAYIAAANANPEECIMIGDSYEQDIIAPKSFGMSAIHIDRAGETSGSIKTLDELFDKI